MIDNEVLLILLFAGAIFAVIMAIALLFTPDNNAAEKRVERIKTKKRTVAARSAEAQSADRRKKVQEKLEDVETLRAQSKKVPLRLRLVQAGLSITPRQYYIYSVFSAIAGFALGFFGGLSPMLCAAIAFVFGLGLPRWFVSHLANARQKKFMNEFANTLDVMVRGVKSGLPLVETLEVVSTEAPEPIRSEFKEVVEQQRIGIPLSECLDRLFNRMPLPDVRFFQIVVTIQQQSGGSLSEALSNLSGVLRARTQMAAKVKALSAEAKASAAILAALPFFVMGSTYALNPEYISMLWREKVGHMMLTGAAVWMSIGVLVMRNMINFKY